MNYHLYQNVSEIDKVNLTFDKKCEVLLMFTKELSANILKIVNERDMTLVSLAEAAGLTREYVGNIASGKQVPTLTSFEKICSALELEPNDLLVNEKSKTGERAKAMRVNTSYCQKKGDISSYIPICPNCNSLLQNSWQSYCDYCGQKLSWERYIKSNVTMDLPHRKSFKD